MTIVNGYCTEAQLRTHLADSGATLAQALLERAIGAASRAIDLYCGRKFWLDAAVVARTYRPRESDLVNIDDIGTTTGVIVKTDTTGDGTFDTTWDASDYDLLPRNAGIAGAGSTADAHSWFKIATIDEKSFPVDPRRATLQVTAKWGWSSIPVAVEEACILKAASLFKRKDSPSGVAGFGEFGVVRVTRSDPDVIELLWEHARLSRVDV